MTKPSVVDHAAPVAVLALIDVRTPAEFAAGHLAGAVNYNVEDGTLERALPSLERSTIYEVYCHSGRRAGIAVALMISKGFTHVTNIGGITQAAASTGRKIITGA